MSQQRERVRELGKLLAIIDRKREAVEGLAADVVAAWPVMDDAADCDRAAELIAEIVAGEAARVEVVPARGGAVSLAEQRRVIDGEKDIDPRDVFDVLAEIDAARAGREFCPRCGYRTVNGHCQTPKCGHI